MVKMKYDDFLEYDEATGTYYKSAEQSVRDEVEKKHWRTTGHTILTDWRLYLMLVPMIFVYVCWKYFPMYELMGAFKDPSWDNQVVANQYWVGLRFFKDLLWNDTSLSPQFWNALRNTFTIAFYSLLFGFPTPIILALFFNEIRSNGLRSVLQVCVYLPKFLSTVIVTSLALVLFRGTSGGQTEGVLSRVFAFFGAETSANGLIKTTTYYRSIFIMLDLWEHAGYDSIVFFAAVIAVSPTSYEAAQIDGAGKMAQMRYVVIPSILSTVIIMLIMKLGSLLSVSYEKVYLLLGNGNYEVAQVVSTLANTWSSGDTTNGNAYGMAAEMMVNLVGMILVIGSNSIARRASDVSLY